MKYEQAFVVAQDVATVWNFFEQFEQVAQCMPGMQKVEIADADNVTVTLTQRLGPMAATFEAKVQITERVARERIAFASTGKAVRGAIGNFRSTNQVSLAAEGAQTRVTVVGDVALGGALGSVGQKVIAKQAEKVTTEFSKNLERVLSGDATAPARAADASPGKPCREPVREAAPVATVSAGAMPSALRMDPWPRISAMLSAAALVVSLIVLWHVA
ncbi:CoxG family protein [Paraburkholderia tagetis]|uniref:SRPBCC family protein n=1 Tax=Paraburkholderia tagetis TaxID=2913261 RepID=A0A9X1RUD4_9BURK|nr:SRPBCC family protein [Paraburkholderia tagetis]